MRKALALSLGIMFLLQMGALTGAAAVSPMLSDAPPADYYLKHAWHNGSTVQYYDFGETENTTALLYSLVYANGTMVPQAPIISAVDAGVFSGVPRDPEYTGSWRIVNVTVPDAYTINSTISASEVQENVTSGNYTLTQTDLYMFAPTVSNGSVLHDDPIGINPMPVWYNRSTAHVVPFVDPGLHPDIFDAATGTVNTTEVYILNISGQKPVLMEPATVPGHSPIWHVTYVEVPDGYIPDSFRSWADVQDAVTSDPANYTASDGGYVAAPGVGMQSGPAVLQHQPGAVYPLHHGWHKGKLVSYYDFGDASTELGTIWMFYYYNPMNGNSTPVDGQFPVIDAVPAGVYKGKDADDAGYSPFMRLVKVLVDPDYEPNSIKSYDEIADAGLTLVQTDTVYHMPVVPKGSVLEDRPDEVEYVVGWYRDMDVYMYSFEKFSTDEILVGGEMRTSDMYVFNTTGARPILDTITSSSGYSPLREVSIVEVPEDFVEDFLRSEIDIQSRLDNQSSGYSVSAEVLKDCPTVGSLEDGPQIFVPAGPQEYQLQEGWYQGNRTRYFDMGETTGVPAQVYMLYYNNDTPVPGQKYIFSEIPEIFLNTQPTQNYSQFWRVVKVMVPTTVQANDIKSAEDLAGYPMYETRTLLDAPLVPLGSSFEDGRHLMQGWYMNNPVYYADFGEYTSENETTGMNVSVCYLINTTDSLPLFTAVPGDSEYSPLCRYMVADAPEGYTPNSIKYTWQFSEFNLSFTSHGLRNMPVVAVTTQGIPPEAHAGQNMTVKQMETVVLDGTSSWDNTGIVNYTWIITNGLNLTYRYGPVVEVVFEDIGTYTVTLNVTDEDGYSDEDSITITVIDGIPPTADAGSDMNATAGTPVLFDATGSTDNIAITNYTWDFGDGSMGWGPQVFHTYAEPGTYHVELTVCDEAGNCAGDRINVTVERANTPPVVAQVGDKSVYLGDELVVTVVAVDPENDQVTYTMVSGPRGMKIDTYSGVITWIPAQEQLGTHMVTVEASDGRASSRVSFNVTVQERPQPSLLLVRFGPVTDSQGKPIQGAVVNLSYDTLYSGITMSNGTAYITVPSSWAGKSVVATVHKEGFEDAVLQGTIGKDGYFVPSSGAYSPMKRLTTEKQEMNATYLTLVLVILIGITVVIIFMKPPTPKAGPEEAEEEEEEEEEEPAEDEEEEKEEGVEDEEPEEEEAEDEEVDEGSPEDEPPEEDDEGEEGEEEEE